MSKAHRKEQPGGLSDAQWYALKWLHMRGGTAVFDPYNRVVAGGIPAGARDVPILLKLVSLGFITGGDAKLTITEAGNSLFIPELGTLTNVH